MNSLITHPLARALGLLLAASPCSLLAQPAAREAASEKFAALAITPGKLVRDRRVVVGGWSRTLADTVITDLAGRDISTLLAPKLEERGVSVALATEPFVMKPREVQLVGLSDPNGTVLPGGLVLPLSPGPDHGGVATAAWFRLAVSASPRPAPWQEVAGDYVTQVKFAVRLSPGAPPTLHLPQPVDISLDFDGMTGPAIAPFSITDIGLAHERSVDLRFRPSAAQPKLRIRSTITDSDVLIEALPRLELRPGRSAVLGFGLETVAVVVERLKPHGDPNTVTESTPVDVQVGGPARLTTDSLVIPAGTSRAEFSVRSAGLGPLDLRATVGGLTATATVSQRFPVGPLIAALIGGALGGFARRWLKGARRDAAPRHTLEGIGVGLVAFVAAVLGVGYLNLPAAIAATEAGAFLIGTACGFAGVTVLATLSRAKRVEE